MNERISEDFCEMLEEQLEKMVRKGDISPSEMDNAYKAVKTMYYLDEMKKSEEGYSQRGGSGASGARGGGSSRGNSNASYGSYEGGSGGSYGSYEGGGSNDYSGEGNSGRRGRDARGRYTSRDDEKEQMKRALQEMQQRLEQM